MPGTLVGSKPCKKATKLPQILEMPTFLKIKETIYKTAESVFSGISVHPTISVASELGESWTLTLSSGF